MSTFTSINNNIHVSYTGEAGKNAAGVESALLRDEVEIIPLGSGGEVGRSCVIVKYKGKTIMFDCGNHPAKVSLDSLPFFDSIKAEDVDLVLITHFHLDHCGALPFFVNQTSFSQRTRRGETQDRRIFMTSATKAFYQMVMKDFVRVGAGAEDLVNKEWLQNTMEQIDTIEYHEEKVINNIRFQAYNAGHVLGAAMFLVEINDVRILYTGDFSRVPDRHLLGAEIPYLSPDIVIAESTNGIRELESREEREHNFTSKIHEVVSRGGKCLVPVFALGRAQELLLILEEYWEEHKDLQNIPIYYASSLAHACMKLYQTFVNAMNERVKEQHAHHKNPFVFKYIRSLLDLQSNNPVTHEFLHHNGPCVVLASPGMLQSGLSLQLFERWCGDKKNGIIMAGYCIDGTLAKSVLDRPREVVIPQKSKMLPLRMGTIEAISFSAHSDGKQTRDFIGDLPKVKHIVLVHGNVKAMEQLKNKLTQDFQERKMAVYTTTNQEAIRIRFEVQRTAKVMGKLATMKLSAGEQNHSTLAAGDGSGKRAEDGSMLQNDGSNNNNTTNSSNELQFAGGRPGDFVSGVLLSGNSNQSILIHPDDVSTFTNLNVTTVRQAIVLPLPRQKSTQQILETLQSYFAQSAMFADVSPVEAVGTDKIDEENQQEKLNPDNENIVKIMVSPDVVVEVKNNPNILSTSAAQTILSIVWKTSNYSDLLADVTCIALSKLAVDNTKLADINEQKEGMLPVDVSGHDKLFRIKCFHHMLSQYYNGVTTNLVTGHCSIPLPSGFTAHINDCIELEIELVGNKGSDQVDLKKHYNSQEVFKLKNILKRTYLTLFPIPADNGWCDCGMIHGDEIPPER